MRAIEGNHRVSTWRKLAGITAASALAVSVLAGTAQAAAPGWPTGHGTNYLAPAASGASSSSVRAGNTAGFFEWLHNPGSSNISQLFMNVSTGPGPVKGVAWSIQDDAGTVQRSGTCTITAVPLCSFGSLNAGLTLYVVAAFTMDSGLADGATQAVVLDFNSTGIPPGGNKSHGDDVFAADSIQISKNADANGDFNFDQAAALIVATDSVGGANTQSTRVKVGGTQVGAFVGDSPSLPAAKCTNALIANIVLQNPWFSCKKVTSLTSVVEVGNGKIFTNANGGPGIELTVTFLAAPNQLNGAHPFAYHYFVDASGEHAELITAQCQLVAGLPSATTPAEGCLIIGGSSITAWLFHNGGMRY